MVVFRRLSETNLNDGEEKEELIQQGIAKWQLLNETMSSIRLITIPSLTDVSSSVVRGAKDEAVLSNLITEPVLEYIKQKKLYAFADNNEPS
jgi:nicotinic acid mononucleotide adenylyltransferase